MLKTFKVMKGFELVKREDHWGLYNEDGHKIAATIPSCNSKLSLKNCEAIANGYDLDELANRAFDNMGYHSTVTPYEEKQFKLGYMVAFREVLEILGDKKFSEEDMREAISQTRKGMLYNKKYEDEYIQSLQQTEFEVEICCYIGNGDKESDSFKDPLVTNTGIPKLDENGCLILRRKENGR